MLLSNRTLRLALESAEAAGIARDDVLHALDLDLRAVTAERGKIEWATVVAVFDELSRRVGDEPDRLWAIGRGMADARSSDVVRSVARGMVSPRALYAFVDRWVAPELSHLRLFTRFVGDDRLQLHVTIPEPYASCEAFLQVFSGRLASLPELLGLPPSTVLESVITPRTADLVLELPKPRGVRDRVRRLVRAAIGARERRSGLEEQRQALAENIESLQESRDELRTLLDRLPDLVVVHIGGEILWANRLYIRTYGYEGLDHVVGTSLFDIVTPASRPRVVERMRQPPDAVDALSLVEVVTTTRAGAEVILEVSPAQSVVFDGVPARLVVGRDITERIRFQQRLMVADRMASVGLLAAGVAHEVNNPLAYVLNNIEIARKELSVLGPRGELGKEVLSIALEGVDRIRTIVRDLLLLSRGDSGPLDVVDVRTVARSTLALASREIERTARLVQDFGPAPLVKGTEPRIAQLLLNLVSNALEAMQETPREKNELAVRVGQSADGRLLLEVSDTGCGIADAHLPHVFEPFFTTKPAGEGTGLGLSITQRLVIEIGGEISVTSALGRGTTFRVLLPASIASDRATIANAPCS